MLDLLLAPELPGNEEDVAVSWDLVQVYSGVLIHHVVMVSVTGDLVPAY